MTQRRLRQANLMGPSGFVSIDDSEVMSFAQQGLGRAPEACGVVELGGRDWKHEEMHGVTEFYLRSLYDHYRRVMDLA